MLVGLLAALLAVMPVWAAPSGYSDVVVDPMWEAAVWADPLLLSGSASVLSDTEGTALLAAVGFSQAPATATPAERMSARRVAEAKAKAAIARFIGSTVETTSTLETERVTVTTTDDEARQQRISAARKNFREITTERAQQTLRGVRVLGSWTTEGTVAVLVGVEVPKL
jgi:hypothetical protein